MSGFSNPLVGVGGALVYPQIKSPNFSIPDETGWAILKSGLAYFFGIVISGHGTITGPDYIINSAGAFFYSGTPAIANLIVSVASAGGEDAFGNIYPAGIMEQDDGGIVQAILNLGTLQVTEAGQPGALMGPAGFSTGSITIDGATGIIAVDTWHSLGTLAGYTVTEGRYRLTPQNEVQIDIQVTAGGSNANTVTFANPLPAAYRPLADRQLPMAEASVTAAGENWPRIFVQASTGDVQVIQTASDTNGCGVTVRIPLD
jgi:hypothetical protein